ncbi:MAG TPA: DUF1259 domain-containing protein [Nitrososphaeraceae archaeon]|nr:DUF1259 domain-containing protein [Nitrososphaeraceae archaeon]
MWNRINIRTKNELKKNVTSAIIIASIAAGFLLLSAANYNLNPAYAQSGAGNTQQPSSPSSKPSQPQVGQVYTFNEKSLPPNAPQFCASLASVVKGKAVPDYNLCDVIVYRQAPAIVRNDGMVLNNYSGFGHYIEFAPAVINSTTSFAEKGVNMGNMPPSATSSPSSASPPASESGNITAAFGEWALLDSEVVPVQKVMEKYNWTQTALHSHMLGETPKMLFLHWAVTGNPIDIINQAKQIMMQTSTYQNVTGPTRTPSSAGP